MSQDAQSKLREAPTAEEVAWLREREKSFNVAVEKMKQECVGAQCLHASDARDTAASGTTRIVPGATHLYGKPQKQLQLTGER
jgi:hypothetical protein